MIEKGIDEFSDDGLPTMGEEAEANLKRYGCVCGKPGMLGVWHRNDAPCVVGNPDDRPFVWPV